jgi:hypothetical protein
VQLFSRTKLTKSTDDWHVAFAELFLPVFTGSDQIPAIQQRIRQLAFIPLTTPNQWTGAPGLRSGGSNRVYSAYCGSTAIPETLSLRLLDKTASQNATRREFYRALGVQDCPKNTVFDAIKSAHRVQLLEDPVDHLQFLYHQGYKSDDIQSWIQIPLTNGKVVAASSVDLYFPSDGEFDMYQLLPHHDRFHFLTKELFEAELPTVRVKDEDWKTWLARITGAKYYPPLNTPSGVTGQDTLSSGLTAVQEHNQIKFLATLRAHWDQYQIDAHLVELALEDCLVPCKSGSENVMSITYLPTSEIITEAARLGMLPNDLPVLELPDAILDEATYRSWRFLEEFGVGSKPNLQFYITVLEVKSVSDEAPDLTKIEETYRCIARLATIQDYDYLR